MKRDAVALMVAGVALEGEDGDPCVLLKNKNGELCLSIPVGAFEATAILLEVEGIQPERPLTHDLMAELFTRHGYRLDRFELYGRGLEGFLGRLCYHRHFRRYTMEVRPSDGLALALRLCAPILVAKTLLEDSAGKSISDAYDSALFLQSGHDYPMRA